MSTEEKVKLDRAVRVHRDRMSGTPCFRDTRVPVQSLIDFLETGETVDHFLALYPSISCEQVMTVLDFANRQLIECASSLTSA